MSLNAVALAVEALDCEMFEWGAEMAREHRAGAHHGDPCTRDDEMSCATECAASVLTATSYEIVVRPWPGGRLHASIALF